jgi:hypothetical protein
VPPLPLASWLDLQGSLALYLFALNFLLYWFEKF